MTDRVSAVREMLLAEVAPWYEKPPRLDWLVAYETAPDQRFFGMSIVCDFRLPHNQIWALSNHDLFPVGPDNPSWRANPPDQYEAIIKWHAELTPEGAMELRRQGEELTARIDAEVRALGRALGYEILHERRRTSFRLIDVEET